MKGSCDAVGEPLAGSRKGCPETHQARHLVQASGALCELPPFKVPPLTRKPTRI